VKCDLKGEHSRELNKMIYPGLWQFLPAGHPQRKPGSNLEFLPTTDRWLKRSGYAAESGNPNATQATGVLGIPALTNLSYWSWTKGTALEPMHIQYNHGECSIDVHL
jgi:hypothetical protein